MGYALRKLNKPRLDGHSYLYGRVRGVRGDKKYVPRAQLRIAAAETACRRVREYLFERGELDKGLELGWMKHVSDWTGLPYEIARGIIHGDITSLTLYAAQRFSDRTGVPLHVLYAS